jgi:hypothetical protein
MVTGPRAGAAPGSADDTRDMLLRSLTLRIWSAKAAAPRGTGLFVCAVKYVPCGRCRGPRACLTVFSKPSALHPPPRISGWLSCWSQEVPCGRPPPVLLAPSDRLGAVFLD